MKIFFLEERLANGDQNSNVDLINANAELKVIKYLICNLQTFDSVDTSSNDFKNDFKFSRYKMGV